MSETGGRPPLTIIWSPEARANLRAIDKPKAMEILYCLTRYKDHRLGSVKKLKPPHSGFRLRCGDYRLFFELNHENAIEITGVFNRREAYR